MVFKSGFVAICGRPNAGKSTLLNALVKRKVAIISPKAQTTRNTILGILTDHETQVIFVDTPGIHKPHDTLGETMNAQALNATKDVECILYMIDAGDNFGAGDQFLIEKVKQMKSRIILVINKIDTIGKQQLYNTINLWKDKLLVDEIVPISALKNDNLDVLLSLIKKNLPEGPKYYPDGIFSIHPESFIMAELIREKILLHTYEEVPHSVAVLIEKIGNVKKNGSIDVDGLIIVERPSQKGIIIGKQGSMLKIINRAASYDMEKLLGNKINLTLFVKVEANWRNSAKNLKEFGYSE